MVGCSSTIDKPDDDGTPEPITVNVTAEESTEATTEGTVEDATEGTTEDISEGTIEATTDDTVEATNENTTATSDVASMLPGRTTVFGEDINTFPNPNPNPNQKLGRDLLIWKYRVVGDKIVADEFEAPLSHKLVWQ